MSLFLNPATVADALAKHFDESGQTSVLDAIKSSHARPLQGDPIGKALAAARVQDPNADDFSKDDEDLDTDEDMDDDEATDQCAAVTQNADIKTRTRLRRKAQRKLKARDPSNFAAAKRDIQKIHAGGARQEDPDEMMKRAIPKPRRYRGGGETFELIKAAQAQPLTMQRLFGSGNNNHAIDMDDVQRIIARGRREMRKAAGISGAAWRAMSWPERRAALGMTARKALSVPFSRDPNPAGARESSNSTIDDDKALADDGASTATVRQPVPSQPFSITLGGFSDSAIATNDARILAAVAATGASDRELEAVAIKLDLSRPARRQMVL